MWQRDYGSHQKSYSKSPGNPCAICPENTGLFSVAEGLHYTYSPECSGLYVTYIRRHRICRPEPAKGVVHVAILEERHLHSMPDVPAFSVINLPVTGDTTTGYPANSVPCPNG